MVITCENCKKIVDTSKRGAYRVVGIVKDGQAWRNVCLCAECLKKSSGTRGKGV